MKRVFGSVLCVAAWVVIGLLPVETSGEDIETVRAKGQGVDEAGAVKDALRHAIEKGGQSEIASRSKTKDFALEFDIILSRSQGLVKGHKVLSVRERDGITTVEIEAQVSKSLIDATWADVTIQLKQLGRPKIMVMFTEVIHDLDRPEGSREIVQRQSLLGVAIERKLLKLGFKLVNPSQMKEIDRKKAEAAVMDDDTAALKAIAGRYGAAIYIKGG